jgi:predicted Fe-Mo cluster-binding NifX family protein
MRGGKVVFGTIVENRFRNLERHRGVKAAESLAEMGVEEVWTRAAISGKGAGYALEAFGIDVITAEATTLRELISEIAQNPDWIRIKSKEPSSP